MAEGLGKVFILKFNEPDAVLFSFREFEKLEKSLKKIEHKDGLMIGKVNEDPPSSDKTSQINEDE